MTVGRGPYDRGDDEGIVAFLRRIYHEALVPGFMIALAAFGLVSWWHAFWFAVDIALAIGSACAIALLIKEAVPPRVWDGFFEAIEEFMLPLAMLALTIGIIGGFLSWFMGAIWAIIIAIVLIMAIAWFMGLVLHSGLRHMDDVR